MTLTTNQRVTLNSKATTNIYVLIVDDHPLVRSGIKSLFTGHSYIKVIGEASDGAEALEILGNSPCDVALMDINMPKLGGIETTAKIVQKYKDVKVLALTMLAEQRYITQMLQAGAKGYVLKSIGKDELVMAINKIQHGETYFSQEVSSLIMSKFMEPSGNIYRHRSKTLNESLTQREIEILKLIVNEYTNQEIASKLNLSHRTIDTHRRNILLKLEVKNTAGLVRYAIENRLLDQ